MLALPYNDGITYLNVNALVLIHNVLLRNFGTGKAIFYTIFKIRNYYLNVYLTLPYLTLPCLTLPCLTLPFKLTL